MSNKMNGKILQAALDVVAREKISGTRMHLIAKEANMSQSNLHYYFPTKNDLLVTLMDELQERFSEKRVESVDVVNHSLEENIQGLFKEKKDDIINHKKIDYAQFDFWVQGTVDPVIREKFQKSFEEWRNNINQVLAHSKKKGQDEMLSYIMVSLMMGASMQYLIDEEKFDLDAYFETATAMILKMVNDD